MRKDLFMAFLGLWVIAIAFLPISCGSTQTATLIGTGVVITALAVWSFSKSRPA